MRDEITSRVGVRARTTRLIRSHVTWPRVLVGLGCATLAAPGLAESWKLSASASATETYTSNVNYGSQNLAEGDWATTVGGTLGFSGEGARLKLNGSIGASFLLYANQTQNNSFAPTVNLNGEAGGDREIRLRRCPGLRHPVLPVAVRRAADQPRQRHPEPLHVADLYRQPLHPGRAGLVEHFLPRARRQLLDIRQQFR